MAILLRRWHCFLDCGTLRFGWLFMPPNCLRRWGGDVLRDFAPFLYSGRLLDL